MEDRYKEGVDFEWVKADNSNYKTRKFFTKKEKAERAKPETKKDKPKAAPKSAPKAAPKKDDKITTKKLPPRTKGGQDLVDMATKAIDRADKVKGRKPKKRPETKKDTKTGPKVDTSGPVVPPPVEDWGIPKKYEVGDIKIIDGRRFKKTSNAFGGTWAPDYKPMFRKGGLVKSNCGASMKPTQGKK